MAVGLSPIGNDAPFFLSTGVPASGAKLFIYAAVSTTKATSYSDSGGLTQNANPVLLNSSGYPASAGNVVEIWLTTGSAYKFVLSPSTDSDPPASAYWTRDSVSMINDVSSAQNEWVAGPAPTFVSATSFTLVGDQTVNFTVGRRLKTTNTAGTIYSTIVTSAFTTLTTVTVVNDSGTLDSGLSAVNYGILQATNKSIPVFNEFTALTSVAGTNTITASATKSATGYVANQLYVFIPANTNSGATTLNLNGQGAKNVFAFGSACAGGEIVQSVPCLIQYDGTQFNIVGPTIGTRITNSLGSDVSLNNTGNYFSGPTVAQGTSGVWFASGTVTCLDTAGAASFLVHLWDGTTVIASALCQSPGAAQAVSIALSGYLSAPAGNIRIDVKDSTSTSGVMKFNVSGNSKDSTLSVVRIG